MSSGRRSYMPRISHTEVDTDSRAAVIGRSTYRLTYCSKLSIILVQGKGGVKVLSPYIDVKSRPGFTLQKVNDQDSYEVGAKRTRPMSMGTTHKHSATQFIAMTPEQARGLFAPELAGRYRQLIADETEPMLRAKAERCADLLVHTTDSDSAGALDLCVALSNFNVIKKKYATGSSDVDESLLLGQVCMREGAAPPGSSPLAHFSAPATDILGVLGNRDFAELVRKCAPPPPVQSPSLGDAPKAKEEDSDEEEEEEENEELL